MEFVKYHSIENSYQEDFLNLIFKKKLGNNEFLVQEKVHGANLSFITNGKDVLTAKRTGILNENEDFFNYTVIRDKYKENIINTFLEVLSIFPETKYISIFGELFGGDYEHNLVNKFDNASKIQKGISYAPYNDFYAFDILINGEKYIDLDIVESIFKKVNFLYSQTLFRGSLAECLKFSNSFESTIPKILGLPEIKENICEGVVIKAVDPIFIESNKRLILKNKNDNWKEVSKKKEISEDDTDLNISSELKELVESVSFYINENRLNNVTSHIGKLERDNFGKILGAFNKDILIDFEKSYKDKVSSLSKEDFSYLKKYINKTSGKFINKKILDRELDIINYYCTVL